jgi:hypothetical protein
MWRKEKWGVWFGFSFEGLFSFSFFARSISRSRSIAVTAGFHLCKTVEKKSAAGARWDLLLHFSTRPMKTTATLGGQAYIVKAGARATGSRDDDDAQGCRIHSEHGEAADLPVRNSKRESVAKPPESFWKWLHAWPPKHPAPGVLFRFPGHGRSDMVHPSLVRSGRAMVGGRLESMEKHSNFDSYLFSQHHKRNLKDVISREIRVPRIKK